jgi:outer membrane receptor protein involved in Fe transport
MHHSSERGFFVPSCRLRPKRRPAAGKPLACLLALGGALATGTALGQAAADQGAATNQNQLQEVVVTGSRIPVPANIGATSPITTVNNQAILLAGQTDTTQILNQLPQNIIAANADFGNNTNALTSSGGTATADLRGLGPQRTLVLVDGKRLFFGDPNPENPNPAADLDQIPAIMIDHVDVVTGGASAVYGSDAIGGVINFITKKNFQGIEIDGQYGFYDHNNGQTGIQNLDSSIQAAVGPTNPTFTAPSGSTRGGYNRDLSILLGTNTADGNGNITAYFAYHNQAPVTAGQRDFSHCQLVDNSTNDGFDCIGTTNSNYFQPENNPANPNNKSKYNVVGNQFVPFGYVGASPPWEYNPNPFVYIQRQDERWNTGFNAHIDLNDHIKPYLVGAFMDDRTTEIVGPSAAFRQSYPFTADNYYRVNCSNPLLSSQEQTILGCTPAEISADAANPGSVLAAFNMGRRNIEGGGRVAFYDHTNYRIALGAQGDFLGAWSYDAYGQYYYTQLFNSNTNYLNYASIGQALIATGTATNPTCTVSAGGCVPWNIFTQGGVTPAQLAYLQSPGTGYGTDSEGIAHIDITGELGQYGLISPFAHDGVAMNIGAEHRGDTYDFSPDAVEAAGDLSGFAGAVVAIHAADSVDEGFLELRAPLMQDRPWAHELDADVGYRYSSYSLAGKTNTYKFEVQYAPTSDFRLRYSYDRAVRAPNLFELFSPQSYGQTSVVAGDPCSGSSPTASLAACERTGVTPGQYGSIPDCVSAQCGQVIGGNPKLKPEEADTYSIGITLTPSSMRNFIASVDYWHIAQFGLVGSVPANILFNDCINSGTPFDCSQIVRNPVTGSLTGATVAGGGYILQTDINTGSGLTSGVDVQMTYRRPLGAFGSVTATLNGTYLEHSISTPYPGAQSYDCAGLFGASCNANSVNPRWRHTLRLDWDTPWDKLLLSVNWRFIGETHYDNNSVNPVLQFAESANYFEGFAGYDSVNARIPNYSYFDFAAIWPAWRGFELRAGINNAFDKDPPILSSEIVGTGSANAYPTYDLLGRQVFVAFSAKF